MSDTMLKEESESNTPNLQHRFVPLTLRHNFSWNMMGNIIYTVCQWGMLVVLAKVGNPEMVGQFTLGFAIVAPIMLFTGLQLRSIQATDARNDFQFGDYLSLRVLGLSTALLTVVGLVLWLPFPPATRWIILAIAIAKIFESISEILHGFFQLCERMDRIARSLILKGPLSLFLLVLGVQLTGTVLGGVVGLVIAWGVVLWFHDLRVTRSLMKFVQTPIVRSHIGQTTKIVPTWRWESIGKLLVLSWPLGFVILLISLNVNVPRYFIESYQGDRDLGIFAAMAYLPIAGDMVINALGQSASPRLAQYYAVGDRQGFLRIVLFQLCIAAGMGAIGVAIAHVAGREILTLLYSREFAEQSHVFVLLIVAASLGYLSSLLGYSMTAIRRFRVQAPLFLAVVGTTAFLCYQWIPIHGLAGAVWALIVAAGLQLVMSAAVLTHALLQLHPQLSIQR
jgi:O-antigen/teichoic acid export membrane protein